MSFLFSGASDAAAAQNQAAMQSLLLTQANETNSINALDNTTAQAEPYLQQNYNTGQQGTTALGNALGLNGPAGSQTALAQLQTTPGYQFTKGQGDNAINAAAAANGTLNSGNQLTALSNYDSGLASNTANNYVGQLQPYMGLASSAGNSIANLYSGLGQNQSNVYQNANAAATGAVQSAGNATASADLANQSMDMNLLTGGLKAGASALGGSGLGSALMSGIGAIFSDERLKEDIEPVGELYDGTNVYRYHYKDDPNTMHIGVIAQEIAKDRPDAVHDIGGFLAVDYGRATDYASELAGLLEAA